MTESPIIRPTDDDMRELGIPPTNLVVGYDPGSTEGDLTAGGIWDRERREWFRGPWTCRPFLHREPYDALYNIKMQFIIGGLITERPPMRMVLSGIVDDGEDYGRTRRESIAAILNKKWRGKKYRKVRRLIKKYRRRMRNN